MVWYGMVWYGMVWYGMVWYGMVWYGMVWYGMVWYGMVWYGMVWYGMVWYGMVWNSLVWYGMVWYGMVWYGMVWYGMVWYGMVWYGIEEYSLRVFRWAPCFWASNGFWWGLFYGPPICIWSTMCMQGFMPAGRLGLGSLKGGKVRIPFNRFRLGSPLRQSGSDRFKGQLRFWSALGPYPFKGVPCELCSTVLGKRWAACYCEAL